MLLQEKYKTQILPQLMKDLNLVNPMQAPRMKKIVVNSCLAEAVSNPKILDLVSQELGQITGQKPRLCRAKKSIATFKVREGMPLACMVTLRGKRMYEFFNRLVNVAFPRSRDFKGLPRRGFDGQGNYTLGITEQIIFPEIVHDKVDKMRGMNITIVTSTTSDKDSEVFLRLMGLPLRKQ